MASVAVQKQSRKLVTSLSTPEQIYGALAKVFQESQTSIAAHRKQIVLLKAIQKRSSEIDHEESFNFYFCKLINKVLVVKKSEAVGDRVVKLVSGFVISLQEQFSEDENDDNLFTRFVNYFITHLLRGIESRDKNVRYRVVQFLDFTMSGLGEIDDSLYETLMWSLDKRLHDKEPSIRIKALHCVSRFQETDEDGSVDEVDEATSKLLIAIQNDSSAEVRRAALLNLVKTDVTKRYLLERARDTNPMNRRLVFSRVIKELGDFRTMDSRTREKLLSWGLKDREETVQKACIQMFSQDWLKAIDGDLIELLERLHVTHSNIAELAMQLFFENRKDLIPKISFPPDIWLKLTPEIAFLARTFYHHCFKNSLNEILDKNYPEAAELANLLSKYLQARRNLEDSEDSEDSDFVIEQLLNISVNYDFSDEIGRRAMLQIIRSSLTNDALTDILINVSLQVLRKLSINERDFCSMVNEIITDIRDNNIEEQEQKQESSESNEIKEDEETTTHCLVICKSMLELTNEGLKDNISITTLIDTLISPAVRNTISTIRELGTHALGLCCLLDLDLAINQLYLFGFCLSKGHEELRTISIKVIFDILSVHGSKVLDVKDGVDSLSFHKLLYRTLKSTDIPEVQSLAAQGLCKLYLADILNDDELFETLILTYYNPANSKNQGLLQVFTFCLPVYCFSHPQHQERMSRVAADAFKRLYAAHVEDTDSDDKEMVSPSIILQQLIYWTDPTNVVNQDSDYVKKSTSHVDLAAEFLDTFQEIENKKYRKLILTNLSKMVIGSKVPYKNLAKLLEVCDNIEDEVASQDAVSKNAFSKFLTNVHNLAETAKENEKDEVNPEDFELSVILESQNKEKDDEAGDEVDEEFELEQSQILNKSSDDDDLQENVSKDHEEEEDLPEFHSAINASTSIDQDGDFSME